MGSADATSSIEGTQNIAAEDILFQGEGVYDMAGVVAHDTTTTTTTKKGLTSRQSTYEHTSTPVFAQALLAAGRKIHFDDNRRATLTGVALHGQTLQFNVKEQVEAQPLIGLHHHISQTTQKSLVSGVKMSVDSGQQVALPTVLGVGQVINEGAPLKLVSVEWDREKTKILGMYEEAVRDLNSWHHVEVKTTGIPPAALAVAAVAFTIMTGGGGASLYSTLQSYMAGMTTMGQVAATTFGVICRTAGAKLIASGGDIEGTLRSTFSREGFLSLAGSLAAEGIMDHLDIAAPSGYASLGKIATFEAKRAVISSGVSIALGQQKLKEALKGAGVSFITSVIGRYGAQKIGKAYGGLTDEGKTDPDGPKIGSVEHKLLHAALGAGLGAIQGDAAAGAIGGLVSELVADTFSDKKEVIAERVQEKADEQGITFGTEAYDNLVQAEIKSTMDWSKIAAAAVTALAGRDINISVDVATNALENNFLPLIVAGVILAVEAANVGMMAYDAYNAYEEDGMGGVARSVGTDLLVGAATAGAGKLVLKGGKRVWVTTKQAIERRKQSRAVSALTDPALPSIAAKVSESSSVVTSLGLDSGQAISQVIHKNSLKYVGDTHLYVIRDKTGKILKYGESAMGKTKDGLSKRAEAQARRLKRDTLGERYTSEIVKEFDSKAAARHSETKYIKTHRKLFGKDSLPQNKSDR